MDVLARRQRSRNGGLGQTSAHRGDPPKSDFLNLCQPLSKCASRRIRCIMPVEDALPHLSAFRPPILSWPASIQSFTSMADLSPHIHWHDFNKMPASQLTNRRQFSPHGETVLEVLESPSDNRGMTATCPSDILGYPIAFNDVKAGTIEPGHNYARGNHYHPTHVERFMVVAQSSWTLIIVSLYHSHSGLY